MNVCKSLKMICLTFALAILTGCDSNEFNAGKVAGILQSGPVHLDAEYVILTPEQVECGVKNELWEAPTGGSGRSLARLTDKGRSLNFSDDVSIGDMKFPYVQVRGDFTLAALDVHADRAGPEKDTKLVDVKLGVPISNNCFPRPLVMMGLRKGAFVQDGVPTLLFRLNNTWSFDRIMH